MKTIVEVGAFEGNSTFQLAFNEPNAHVYAFEPQPANFVKLHTQSKHYKNLTILPFAVDNGDNLETLFNHDAGQSTLQHQWGPPGRFQLVWTMRLETFMHLYSIEQIDYLHIDAPFREELILESLGDLANQVICGRVVVYPSEFADKGAVPAWLVEHGFNMRQHQPNGPENPEWSFWR